MFLDKLEGQRHNWTLMKMTRCMLIGSGMPEKFWGEALSTANHLRNLFPSRALGGAIPLELWHKRRLTEEEMRRLKVFGCRAWAVIYSNLSKLSSIVEECVPVMLGYMENGGMKAYRLWSLKREKVIAATDVIFEEHISPFGIPQSKEEQEQKREGPRKKVFVMTEEEDESEETDPEEQPPEELNPDGAIGEEQPCGGTACEEQVRDVQITRSAREGKPVKRYYESTCCRQAKRAVQPEGRYCQSVKCR